MRRLVVLPLTLLPLAAAAQGLPVPVVAPCPDWARADAIREPWEDSIAAYAEGAVRLAVLDMLEPAAGAVHLLVISPPRDEVGGRQCRVISGGEGGVGFFDIDLAGRRAAYDPAAGLTVTIPMQTFDPETGGGEPAVMRVTIDQNSGRIGAEVAR